MNFLNSAVVFLKEVKSELQKTSFPSRWETIRDTAVVILFSLALALFLGLLDAVFSYLLNHYVI